MGKAREETSINFLNSNSQIVIKGRCADRVGATGFLSFKILPQRNILTVLENECVF
ncbi:hypothetical protein A343_0055 [Porphyromonas gingivalis JCVI SC001]|nr:hypothetical protein A343_0055 [Porphyromonas gingivalis JCVI SC001]